MRLSICALAALLISEPALAAPGDCIGIDNDLDRLACYDKEAGRTPKQERVAAPAGEWSIRTETSKMTDETNVYMSVVSKETIDCGWNRGGKVRLHVRCMENTTAMYFNTGCHMASGDYTSYGKITYRLDDDAARTADGTASTDNSALGLWRGSRSIPVIKRMFGKSTMIARMTPYSESAFTATFNIAGLEKSIEPLRKACHW